MTSLILLIFVNGLPKVGQQPNKRSALVITSYVEISHPGPWGLWTVRY